MNAEVPENLLRIKKIDYRANNIFFFADSTNKSTLPSDLNQKSISDALQNELPSISVIDISHNSYHAEIFLEYCKYLLEKSIKPQLIIIPINLRSFSPGWDKSPRYQFENEKIFLKYDNFFWNAFFKPLSVMKVFKLQTVSRDDYFNTLVYDGDRMLGRVADFESDRFRTITADKVKEKLIYFYLYQLRKEHKKVQALVEIAKISKHKNIPVVFYITPINCNMGNAFYGSSFSGRIGGNVKVITDALAEHGAKTLNLTNTLPNHLFLQDSLYPNEHLTWEGRLFVATKLKETIAEAIKVKVKPPSI